MGHIQYMLILRKNLFHGFLINFQNIPKIALKTKVILFLSLKSK